jgi:hypothetical protein
MIMGFRGHEEADYGGHEEADLGEEVDFGGFTDSPWKVLLSLAVVGGGIFFWMNRAKAMGANLEIRVNFADPPHSKPGKDLLQLIGKTFVDIMGKEACPGAPSVNSIVKRSAPFFEERDGKKYVAVNYFIDANFAGEFDPKSIYLREEVAVCILERLRAIVGIRNVAGIRAFRIA